MTSMQASVDTQSEGLSSTGCCPRFEPAVWDEQEVLWHDKPFVREQLRSVFHVPLRMAGHVMHAQAVIDAAHAQADRPWMLGEDLSAWRSNLYVETSRNVPDADMVHLSGTYLTKVFEGPFRDAPKWEHEMQRFLESRGKHADKIYLGYTTCPACAKAYGKNYVVLFARLKESGTRQVAPGTRSDE